MTRAESGGVQLYYNLSPLKFIAGELIYFYHIGRAEATDNIFELIDGDAALFGAFLDGHGRRHAAAGKLLPGRIAGCNYFDLLITERDRPPGEFVA